MPNLSDVVRNPSPDKIARMKPYKASEATRNYRTQQFSKMKKTPADPFYKKDFDNEPGNYSCLKDKHNL